ncbi:signal peptidase II [Salinispira pacifica]
MTEETKHKLRPFILTAAIIAVDQIVKAIIVATIPLNTVGWSVLGGFLRIVHARNLGIAFSIGGSAPGSFRGIFFMALPLVVLAVLVVFYFRSRELTALQRWAIAGILGGGLGNLIDRLFRPHGVVDFIDVKFYGLFGLDRWPTFNIADASVVVCGLLLLVSVLFRNGKGSDE